MCLIQCTARQIEKLYEFSWSRLFSIVKVVKNCLDVNTEFLTL